MDSLANDYAGGLLHAHEPPCLSLYQPTHRHRPQNQQDPIRYRNLLKALEQSLRQKYRTKEIRPLLEPFGAVADDPDFWNHTLDGLAVMGAPGLFRVYRLQRPVPELAVVAESFHIKPLLRILQSADGYQVLGISRQAIQLFEGNRDRLDALELAPGVPATLTEALGAERTEPHLTVASYGGTEGAAMRHGHGGRKDEVDKDTERFFVAVDRAVLERHSRPSGLPLILAGLVEHHSVFRRISRNPFLLDEGVEVHPDALALDALRERVWQVLEPRYLARLAGFVEAFGTARARGLGGDDLAAIAAATVAGRVQTLLVEAGRQEAGRIDPATGRIAFAELTHPEVDDVLDDLGELVLKMGGQIVVVPGERMPTQTGAAAIYRY